MNPAPIVAAVVAVVAKWSDTNTKVLVDVLMEYAKGRFSNLCNKRQLWDSLHDAFNFRAGKNS
jgi:hypothetical protein